MGCLKLSFRARKILFFAVAFIVACAFLAFVFAPLAAHGGEDSRGYAQSAVIPLPADNEFYHGVYPGGITGEEDDLTLNDLLSYERHVGKKAAWVFFSHNWYKDRTFPLETAAWVRAAGSVPYVRLMLRSDAEQFHAEPVFTLKRIVKGVFDKDLRAWAQAARDFGSPIIAEYGTEMNGEWFPWNGMWHGAGSTAYGDKTLYDGPERFRDAYRHIIQICREEGANNITWVFHVNHEDIPNDDWNRFENYYPGDEWIDWLAVSIYGALKPLDAEWTDFRAAMDTVYPRLAALAPDKPIILAEFGVTRDNPLVDQSVWARDALADLLSQRWPQVKGFSWWNEKWENDKIRAHDTTMRVQDNSRLAVVFKRLLSKNARVIGSLPVLAASEME